MTATMEAADGAVIKAHTERTAVYGQKGTGGEAGDSSGHGGKTGELPGIDRSAGLSAGFL